MEMHLLFFFLLIPLSSQLKCTHCPSPVSAPSSCSNCEGDVCFIVVNAFFNGTLSAGCINLLEKDRDEFAQRRKECNREVIHDRTVCACNTRDECNDPRTPLAEFDFISDSILKGYDLQPGVRLVTAEPSVELPTDWSDLLSSPLSSSTSSSSTSTSTQTPPPPSTTTISTTTTSVPPSSTLRTPPSTTRKSMRMDDEEGLIQVKSSVLIKPRNYSRLLPSSTQPTTALSSPPPTPFTREISRLLPTDDAMSLSGVYRVRGPKSDGKVLPTDSDEEEPILIVKSGVMRVKEQEEDTKEGSNRVADVTERSREEVKDPMRHPKGMGSVQETEVSSGVTIGVGGNKPSSLKSPHDTRGNSRSEMNSSPVVSFSFLFCLIYFFL